MSKDEILDSLFGWKGKKVVLWMPTFRKSDLGGCAENEIELPCQLPAIQDMNELKELDSYLREQEIILIIKKHPLQNGNGMRMNRSLPIYVMLRKPCWRKNR